MKIVDMTGKRFGHLEVVKPAKRRDKKGRAFWICKCDCGSFIEVRGDNLRTANTTQCTNCTPKRKTGSIFVEAW